MIIQGTSTHDEWRATNQPTSRCLRAARSCLSAAVRSRAQPCAAVRSRAPPPAKQMHGERRRHHLRHRHRLNRPWANPTTASPPPLPSPSLRSPHRRRRRLLLARHRPGAPPAARHHDSPANDNHLLPRGPSFSFWTYFFVSCVLSLNGGAIGYAIIA